MGNEPRPLRNADVEQFEARGSQSGRLCLVGDGHHFADDIERVRAHFGMRQLGLDNDPRRSRIRDVHAGEILGRGLVREPQDAAPVASELQRNAFADAPEALQLVMRDKAHVQRQRPIGTRCRPGKRWRYRW